MKHSDLEIIYEVLAQKLDDVGEENVDLYLAKLVLLLSHQIGDAAPVLEAIESAAQSLDA
ncbi:MAG: DUF2783 domain-containing protein [Rhizobiaceae bacterium]